MQKPDPKDADGASPLSFPPCDCGHPTLCPEMKCLLHQLQGRAIWTHSQGEVHLPGAPNFLLYGNCRTGLIETLCERAWNWLQAQQDPKNRKLAEQVRRWKRGRTAR